MRFSFKIHAPQILTAQTTAKKKNNAVHNICRPVQRNLSRRHLASPSQTHPIYGPLRRLRPQGHPQAAQRHARRPERAQSPHSARSNRPRRRGGQGTGRCRAVDRARDFESDRRRGVLDFETILSL